MLTNISLQGILLHTGSTKITHTSVQLFSCVWLWDPMDCSTSLSSTNFWRLPRLMSSESWCHPTIASSVVPFSSHLQSLPASGSFPVSHFFTSGGQSIGVSASTSVLPMNTQGWSPLGCSGWISLQSKGLLRVFSNTTVQKHQFFGTQLSLRSNYMTTGKSIALTRQTFVGKVMPLLFNMLSRLVITFLPRSKHLLLSWLHSPSVEILEPPKIKCHFISTVSPIYLPWNDGTGCLDLCFLNVVF